MSRKTLCAAAAILATVWALTLLAQTLARERGPTVADVASDEFAGKIVDIQTTTKRTFVLENVKVVQLGGQWFLSGTGIKKYGPLDGWWWVGIQVRVNLSQVVSYCPMTPEQFKETTGKLDEK